MHVWKGRRETLSVKMEVGPIVSHFSWKGNHSSAYLGALAPNQICLENRAQVDARFLADIDQPRGHYEVLHGVFYSICSTDIITQWLPNEVMHICNYFSNVYGLVVINKIQLINYNFVNFISVLCINKIKTHFKTLAKSSRFSAYVFFFFFSALTIVDLLVLICTD